MQRSAYDYQTRRTRFGALFVFSTRSPRIPVAELRAGYSRNKGVGELVPMRSRALARRFATHANGLRSHFETRQGGFARRENVLAIMQPFQAFDHVQLAMPPHEEETARVFYAGALGMTELEKPHELRARGGAWFASGAVQLHLGVEPQFVPARKAHPALRCGDLTTLEARLTAAGIAVTTAGTFEDGLRHAYIDDPFGNRIELIG